MKLSGKWLYSTMYIATGSKWVLEKYVSHGLCKSVMLKYCSEC